MRNKMLILGLAGLAVFVGAGDAFGQVRYVSERSPHRFAGATRVVLDNFDPMDKETRSASLQLDNNDVTFSEFGEQQITTVYYQSFQIKLTRLKSRDPNGTDRRIYLVELPKEYAATLGESSLRLVAQVGAKSQPKGVRLMLVNRQDQVTDALELWTGTSPGALRFSVSDKPAFAPPWMVPRHAGIDALLYSYTPVE